MPGAVPGFDPNAANNQSSSAFPGTQANLFIDLAAITDAEAQLPVYQNGQPLTRIDGKHLTIGDELYGFEAKPVTDRQETARMLVDKGFLTPAEINNPTAVLSAYGKLLHYAALDPTHDFQKTVSGLPDLPGKPGRNPPGSRTNPLDVIAVGNTVAQRLVGRDLTPQEADAIANQMGIRAYPSDTTTAGATEQYLKTSDSPDVQANSLLRVFQVIKDKVETDAQGSGSRAPTAPIKVA